MKIEIIDKGAGALGRLPRRAKPMDAGADVFAPRNWNLESGQTVKLARGFCVIATHTHEDAHRTRRASFP